MRKEREARRWLREVRGILALSLAAFGMVALATFEPAATSVDRSSPVGPVGHWLGWALFRAFGYASYIFPLALVVYGLRAFIPTRIFTGWSALVGLGLILASATGLLAQARDPSAEFGVEWGGMLGFWVTDLLRRSVGKIGALLVLLTLVPVALLFLTQVSYAVLSRSLTAQIGRIRRRRRAMAVPVADVPDLLPSVSPRIAEPEPAGP